MGAETERSVNPQANILIIDDDETARFSLQTRLTKQGYNVITTDKAEDALYLLKSQRDRISFVITDIQLRKMDGIELLRHITNMENPVPVLLTGQGNIEDAVNALRYGACDFIRKPFDPAEVANVVRSVIKRKSEERLTLDLGQYITSEAREFILPSDFNLANVVSYAATVNLPKMGLCNRSTTENISLAIREAVNNAMFHGNLEVSSSLRETQGIKAYNEMIEQRKNDEKYSSRRVRFTYNISPEKAVFTVEDEGGGFDITSLPNPRNPENYFSKSGRGILIIQLHMDEITWNKKGNIITMIKNKVES